MKKVILIIGGIMLLLNTILGLILSGYHTFNWLLNMGVIVVAMMMLCIVASMPLKDGFRVSFNCLIPFFTLIELTCGSFASEKFNDNLFLVAILSLVSLQIIMLVSTHYISEKEIYG